MDQDKTLIHRVMELSIHGLPFINRLRKKGKKYQFDTWFLILLLFSLLLVTARSLPTEAHLAPDNLQQTYSSYQRLVCPETSCPEKENVKDEKVYCRSDDDCSGQKICCVSNCWTNYTCQDPVVKSETHNEYVQNDFQSRTDEKHEIVSPSEISGAIPEKENRTSSAENDTDISEVEKESSKAKRAARKNTAKAKTKKKPKPKQSVKNRNKKPKKNKKPNSETTRKRSSAKSKKDQKKKVKQANSKHSNKSPVKNNKKPPKPNNKKPAKPVKSSTKTAKKTAKSKQKVTKKIKLTTKRAPTALNSVKTSRKETLSPTKSSVEKSMKNNSETKVYFRHPPLTSNNRTVGDGCDSHVSNGYFKLSFDVKPSDFFDERFLKTPDLKDEKCSFNTWNYEEINIISLDIFRNRGSRFKRKLDDEKIKEIIVIRNRGKKVRVRQQMNEILEKTTTISYRAYENFDGSKSPLQNENENETVPYGADKSLSKTESRLHKEYEKETPSYEKDESFVGMEPPLRKEHENEFFSYESFARTKLSQRNQLESKTTSYEEDKSFVKIEPPQRKDHESETVSYRALGAFVRLKPPRRIEHNHKHHEKSGQWLQESETGEKQSISGFQFESFADLKNFINTNVIKVKGSHMLLLPKKFDSVLSDETNTQDFLSGFIEKLSKNPTNYKITLSHFVPAKYIQKSVFYDILQAFEASTDINPLSSNVNNKLYVREGCVFVPLLRKSFFQISTSPQGWVQLKPLNPKSLSREYAGHLQGRFSLQMKQPCKAMETPSSSTQNGTEKEEKATRNMKSRTNATRDSDSAATSQPPTNSAVQYRMADGKQFFPERTYQQQSMGIDYWIPVFGTLFSELFKNTTVPQGVHKILSSKATTPDIETPNQLPTNNPLISHQQSKESEKSNQLQTEEDWNFRSLFKFKGKQAASNNEKSVGNDDTDVYHEFRDSSVKDFTLNKDRSTPPDDDSFIESPVDNKYEISQQVFGFEKRDSVVDNYDLDGFYGLFQLKTEERTSNNEEAFIGKNDRRLNHDYESQDTDAHDLTMRRKYEYQSESPANNSTKQKNFLGVFKLKSSFKTAKTQEALNNNTFTEPPKNVTKLLPESKQNPGVRKNMSDINENDFFQGIFKLINKDERLSDESKIVVTKPTESSTQTKWLNSFLVKSTPNELLLDKAALPGISLNMDQKITEQGKYKPTEYSDEFQNFHGIFKFKNKSTNKGSYWNPETLLGNGDLPEPSVNVDKAVANQQKHKPVKDNHEGEYFHGMFRLKQKGSNKNNLSSNSESILGNGDFVEPSVDIDKTAAEQKKHKSLTGSEEVENFHGVFRFKSGLSNTRIIDILKDENELNEEDKDELVKLCKSLRHGSHSHASDINKVHCLFRLKPKLKRDNLYQVKPLQKLAQEFEPESMDKFHGQFRIKTEQDLSENGKVPNTAITGNFPLDENTFMDKYEVVIRLKPRTNESDSSGILFKLETFPQWCKNYKRRKEPIWFS